MRSTEIAIGLSLMVGLSLLVGGAGDVAQAAPPKSSGASSSQRVQASLVAEHDAFVPGTTTMLAVVLDIERGWYTYWENPGETGYALGVTFGDVTGLTIGEPIWPAPKRKELPGAMLDYVYTDQVAVLFEVQVDSTFELGTEVSLEAHASWLVCKESCFPEEAELVLKLPVKKDQADGAGARVIHSTQANLPKPLKESDGVFVELDGDVLQVRAAGATKLTFYPDYQEGLEAKNMIADGESKGGTMNVRYASLGDVKAITGVLGVQRMGKTTYYVIRAANDG